MESNRASLCKNFKSIESKLSSEFWEDSSESKTRYYEAITSEYIDKFFPDSIVNIIFGSAASGSSRFGSDVDLIIIGEYGKCAVKRCQTFHGLIFDVQIFDVQIIKQYLMLCDSRSNTSVLLPYAIINGKSCYRNSSYFEELLILAKECIKRRELNTISDSTNDDIRLYSGVVSALLDMSDVNTDWTIRMGSLWRVVGFISYSILSKHGIDSETYGSLKIIQSLEPELYLTINNGISEYLSFGRADILIELSAQQMIGYEVDYVFNYEFNLLNKCFRTL